MKDIKLTISISIKGEHEFTDTERELLTKAQEATLRSYAPYSNFCVGAAVLLDDGTIVTGSNQENCAYPSGTCAERTAIFYANSQYPEKHVKMICVAARDVSGQYTYRPIVPCGSCRQVLVETAQRYGEDIKVMLYGTEGCYMLDSVKDLLPLTFDSTYL